MTVIPPPEPFTTPIIRCPSCDHGIDPHGLDPGSFCGVGDENAVPCPCMWQPNDIAAWHIGNSTSPVPEGVLVPWVWFAQCRGCSRVHAWRPVPDEERTYTWADPSDGHVYRPRMQREDVLRLYAEFTMGQEP